MLDDSPYCRSVDLIATAVGAQRIKRSVQKVAEIGNQINTMQVHVDEYDYKAKRRRQRHKIQPHSPD